MPTPARWASSPVRLRPRRRHHQRSRRPRWWFRRVAAGLAVALLAAVSVVPPSDPALAAEPPPIVHTPPVDAPVVDPFRAPAGPYGPGNRGIEYATRPGTEVRASAAGTVAFAGQVGGRLHVTVAHADGVRTSYSFLATVAVAAGQRVERGDVVGTAGERLHFGARRGALYIDPAALFGGGSVVELLPLDGPVADVATSGPDAAAPTPRSGAAHNTAALAWLRGGSIPTLLDGLARVGLARADAAGTPPCSTGRPPERPVAGERRVAVTVGGLGSTSRVAAVDDLRATELGYEPGRVVRFSYAGGRTPGSGDGLGDLPASDYTAAATHGDVVFAAARLADLVAGVAQADPVATVDIYAHSLGGVVARLALLALHDRGFPLDRLGLVVTLATPHAGADLATAAVTASRRLSGGTVLAAAAGLLEPGLDPEATVVAQLAEGSAVARDLARRGVPPGVRLVSLAARGDLTVPAPRAEVGAATNVTLPLAGPTAHSRIVASDEATAEIARALAGRPPGCEAWDDALADVVVGRAVAATQDQLGALASTLP